MKGLRLNHKMDSIPVRVGVLRTAHRKAHVGFVLGDVGDEQSSAWCSGLAEREFSLEVEAVGNSCPPPPKILTYHYCLCAGVSSSQGGVVCGDLSATRTCGIRFCGTGACGSSCKKG